MWALNTFGWAIDLFANHTYVSRRFPEACIVRLIVLLRDMPA